MTKGIFEFVDSIDFREVERRRYEEADREVNGNGRYYFKFGEFIESTFVKSSRIIGLRDCRNNIID